MSFPSALSRAILVSFIVITNVISSSLAVISFYDKPAGGGFRSTSTAEDMNEAHRTVFQILTICFDVVTLLTVIVCLCHQYMRRGDDAGNTQYLSLFGVCGLLGVALAVSLTVHAQEDNGMGICNDFVHTESPCVHAGVQLGMAYVSPALAALGLVISWMDRFPGAVKVMPRYPITKAPSSHFAAHGHDLDESYTHAPAKTSPGSRNHSGWTDVPL